MLSRPRGTIGSDSATKPIALRGHDKAACLPNIVLTPLADQSFAVGAPNQAR